MVVAAQYCPCIKCHWTVLLKIVKMVSFMLCGKWGRERRREAERQNDLWSQNDTSSLLTKCGQALSFLSLSSTCWEQQGENNQISLDLPVHTATQTPSHPTAFAPGPRDPQLSLTSSPEWKGCLPTWVPQLWWLRPDAAFKEVTSQGQETNTKHRHYEGDCFESWKCCAGNRKQDNR